MQRTPKTFLHYLAGVVLQTLRPIVALPPTTRPPAGFVRRPGRRQADRHARSRPRPTADALIAPDPRPSQPAPFPPATTPAPVRLPLPATASPDRTP